MSPVTLVGFALSLLILLSHFANASSIDLSSNDADSLRLSMSASVPAKSDSIRIAPAGAAAPDASSLQFGSSIAEVGPGNPSTPAVSIAGRSLGVATGAYASGGAVAPRCIVDTPDPAPSVAPEPSSALLFALGLAVLSWAGYLRGWALGHRG
jgi:hypothetical protein